MVRKMDFELCLHFFSSDLDPNRCVLKFLPVKFTFLDISIHNAKSHLEKLGLGMGRDIYNTGSSLSQVWAFILSQKCYSHASQSQMGYSPAKEDEEQDCGAIQRCTPTGFHL